MEAPPAELDCYPGAHLLRDQLQYISIVRRAVMMKVKLSSMRSADVVVIRTVHGSKGLEFPVVFVPDTSGRLTKSMGAQVVYHPQVGLAYKGTTAYERAKGSTKQRNSVKPGALVCCRDQGRGRAVPLRHYGGGHFSWWQWISEILPVVPGELYDLPLPRRRTAA